MTFIPKHRRYWIIIVLGVLLAIWAVLATSPKAGTPREAMRITLDTKSFTPEQAKALEAFVRQVDNQNRLTFEAIRNIAP